MGLIDYEVKKPVSQTKIEFEADKPLDVLVMFDGAAQPNPGEGGAGVVMQIYNSSLMSKLGYNNVYIAKYLGDGITNNQAEYEAVIEAFNFISEKMQKGLYIRVVGDSILVVNQIKGLWKVKHENMLPLHEKVLKQIETVAPAKLEILHISRELNTIADDLSKFALVHKTNYVGDTMPRL